MFTSVVRRPLVILGQLQHRISIAVCDLDHIEDKSCAAPALTYDFAGGTEYCSNVFSNNTTFGAAKHTATV